MSGLSSRLARLKPFSKAVEDEDQGGEEVEFNTIAGGGHSFQPTDITQHQLRVSHALRSFLVNQHVLAPEDAGLDSPDFSSPALQALLDKPHIEVPAYVADRSHPLPEYFISSSHNTYLLAHQLFGTSSATAYETALKTGARCIEIDAWDDDDNKDEPKVTHGFTLVSHIPFRAVCETIRDVVDSEAAQSPSPAPILISLENHCDAHGQLRLVQIMKEVWGPRLLSEAIRAKGHAEQEGSDSHVLLSDLGSKIVVIVEYHFPNEPDSDSSDSSTNSDSEPAEDADSARAKKEYKARKAAAPKTLIIPELAALGVYAQSVKPQDDSWYTAEYPPGFKDAPHHHLINVSETGLAAKLPAAAEHIARHNAKHLMRVFPKGTRVSSMNMDPVPFWGVGAQICALNWQTFGAPLQLNEALFAGTDGFVLKPAYLRGGAVVRGPSKRKLRLHVAGATDVPVPSDRPADEVKLYLSCLLDHPAAAAGGAGKRKTAGYRQHKLGFLHRGDNPPATDPVWDEVLEWEYDDDELVFLRMLVKSDDSFSRNPTFAVAMVRILYAAPGWNFIRMLDLKGRETRSSLLVKIDLEDL
ncbi:phosphatidylinositol-specific phospholipase C [Coniochaeta ligniaria NRRL 30616]|uniref:Phosphoinositide phospholipase C n=1 Tax=Coniochaeta ligniaria NRRL 30616 TaxID=1408157 RepID=A0A1J7IRT1_9PEZI|nr:phosphatidylinositol-specific phospholipase C [Coniochaeta ligniaria NRRL 30616]